MAWVRIGKRKINTALICYVTDEEAGVRVWFTGKAEALGLAGEEGRDLWRYLRSEEPAPSGATKQHTLATPTKMREDEVFDVKDDEPAKAGAKK